MMPIRPPGSAKSIWKDWNFVVLIVCIIGLGVTLYLIWHFKSLAEKSEAQRAIPIIAKSAAKNYPDEVVAKPVVWERDISKVEDYTDLDATDDIYWYFLNYAKEVSQNYLSKNAKEYYFDGLTQNPARYRGAIVKMSGWVGYYTPIRLPKNNSTGLDFVYRVFIKDSWGGNSKECYIYDLVEKPPPLATEKNDGDNASTPVEVEGVFYKTVQYETQGGYPRPDERYAELKEWMEQSVDCAKKGVPYKDMQTKFISQKEHEKILNKLEQAFNSDKVKDKNVLQDEIRDIFYAQMRQRQLPLIIGKGLKIIDEKNAKRELGEFGLPLIALSIFAFIVCAFITIRNIFATRPKPPSEKIGGIRTIKKF